MSRKKEVKTASTVSRKTVTDISNSSDSKKCVWLFDMIDIDGSFAFDIKRHEFEHYRFLEKMIEYSNMSWSEIKKQTHDSGKSKHHFISYDTICKEARARLETLKLTEYSDSLFSFALNNKLRVFGIRIDEYFHVLWYDPKHEIVKSKK